MNRWWQAVWWNGLICLACIGPFASADDWPQWLGPHRDSIWRETGIVHEFPDDGLPVLWRLPVQLGYSGPAVADGRVYLFDYERESGDIVNNPGQTNELTGQERLLCLDAKTGRLLWKYEYECAYRLSFASGPRATPTVHGGKVWLLGAEGNLTCLDAVNGRSIWSRELKTDFDIETPIWGFCGHPLVDGDRLFCLVGGEGSVAVAMDKDTGKELWRALSASQPGYAPPTMIHAAGRQQLLIWDADNMNSLDPATGRVFWSQPLKPDYAMSIMAPRLHGDLLFASGVGNVGAVFRLNSTEPAAEIVWRGDTKTGVYCANSTPFIEDGVIYGTDSRSGSLRAVRLEDGQRLWETLAPTTGQRRGVAYGTAFIVRHEDRYFLFSESGDLILADLSPGGYQELGRFHVLDPTNEAFGRPVVWSHPAFAERCLFARNDRELVCVSLAAE